MTLRPLLLAIPAALLLSGCLSFGEKPPATLLTLTAQARVAPGTARTLGEDRSITVIQPTVPQALSTLRVPVFTGPNNVAFLPKAQWNDAPARLFRDVLAETIAVRTGRPVLDLRQYALAPGARLAGRLTMFGYDAPSRQVVVSYDATLAPGGGRPALSRRFEARADAASEDGGTIAAALNGAANQVAVEVADWVGA